MDELKIIDKMLRYKFIWSKTIIYLFCFSSLIESNSHLVTKRFFNNGITEMKHDRIYSSPSCPSQNFNYTLPTSCKDVKDSGNILSGIYKIKPEHAHSAFMVYCDMETRGGGWTYIHNRFEGAQEFYQNWHEYKHGFGNLGGEFWLGLENIYQLTGKWSELSFFFLKHFIFSFPCRFRS